MKETAALLLAFLLLNGCSQERWWYIRAGGPKLSRQFTAQEKAFDKIKSAIYAKSDTVLNIWCYDGSCREAIYGIYWVYSDNDDMYLQKVKRAGETKLVVEELKRFPKGRTFINFITKNRLDTVASSPSDIICFDCGGVSFELVIGNDTIYSDDLSGRDISHGDSMHLKHQLTTLITKELIEIETTTRQHQ